MSIEDLDRFLATDPRDTGCTETMELLDLYVELLIAGGDPEAVYPQVAAHLRVCDPCAEDLAGLLAAVG